MEKIIGREKELAMLTEIASSNRSEFVAVYGRRRVGKTFLVRSAFKDKFVFYTTGIIEGTYEQELEAFNIGLKRYGWNGAMARNWMEAFNMLSIDHRLSRIPDAYFKSCVSSCQWSII